MKATNLNVRFGDRIVFDHASFEAERGRLCVVKGKSGSGKTTLLKALTFRFPCIYEHDGVRLDLLSEKEQARFLFENVSIVEQEPLLDYDLTVGQNREFILKLYGARDNGAIAERLGASGLMGKYPMQLSQGERVRCAIYLAMLKEPDILLLDEPTASLDGANKETMVALLQEYARDHVVVCSSHDQGLSKAAGRLYEIREGKLESMQEAIQEAERKPLAVSGEGYSGYWSLFMRQFRHHWALNCAAKLALAVAVVFLFVSLSLNNVVMMLTRKALNGMSSRQLVIYQGLGLDGYSYDGSEFPIPKEKADLLGSVGNLSNVVPLISACKNDVWLDEDRDTELEMIVESYNRKDVLMDGERIVTNSNGAALVYRMHSYSEYDLQECKNPMTVYHDEGVVVGKDLFQSLSQGEKVKDPFLRFPLPVPLYNSTGVGDTYKGDDDMPIHCNYQSPYPVWVTLPVRAVLESGGLGMAVNGSQSLYVPVDYWLDMIEDLMEEKQVKDRYELFSVCTYFDEETNTYEYERYIDELPQKYIDNGFLEQDFTIGKTKDFHRVLTRWRPLAYNAYVEDLSKIGETVNELKQMGFEVDNEYVDTRHMLTVQETLKRTLTIVSSISLAIILLGHVVVKWTQRAKLARYMAWLRGLGYDKRQRQNVLLAKLAWEASALALLCLAGYEAARIILLQTHKALVQPDPLVYGGILLACVAVELLIPLAFTRSGND